MRSLLALLLGIAPACALEAAPGGAADAGTGGDTVDALPDGLALVGHDRELRGVWVATVNNIDWPSRPGAGAAEQQAELLAIVDAAADAHLNALFFQVRPEADALYASSLEPWSRYLTGSQGVDPGWDPLAFVIDAAHARNIEVHAWLNPYRARASVGSSVDPSHVSVTLAEHVHDYGSYSWMDPGSVEVQDHTLAVIADIATRYDIDGVHLDDYFYPYPDDTPFPDDATWSAYQATGGTMTLDDWRRENVNTMVRRIHETLADVAPRVRFGISPFGIYRPGQPAGINGLDQYAAIYADPKLWKERGWVDYLAPQLYWATDQTGQEFGKLIQWWAEQGDDDIYTFAGVGLYRDYGIAEYGQQLALSRAHRGERSLGNIHFSMRHVTGEIAAAMRNAWYPTPVLTPPMVAFAGTVMAPPTVDDDGSLLHDESVRAWCVYRAAGDDWVLDRIETGAVDRVELAAGRWAISAVGTHGVESYGRIVDR